MELVRGWPEAASSFVSGLGVYAVILAALVILCLWWWVPRWQLRLARKLGLSLKDRLELENDYRLTLSQVFGGLAVLFGLWFTWQQMEASRNAADKLLLSDKYSKAFELLRENDPVVRAGGVYSLEAVANASPESYWSIMQMLAAYIRSKSRLKPLLYADICPIGESFESKREAVTSCNAIEHDIQAILTVLTRTKNIERERKALNLSCTCLRGAILPRANLSYLDLHGSVLDNSVLTGADFIGTNLSEANFYVSAPGADFSGAIFIKAWFSGGFVAGGKQEKHGGSYLADAEFSNADLTGANLSKVDLADADLSGSIGLTQEQLNAACGNDTTNNYLKALKLNVPLCPRFIPPAQ